MHRGLCVVLSMFLGVSCSSTSNETQDGGTGTDTATGGTVEEEQAKAFLPNMEGTVSLSDGAEITVPLYAVTAGALGFSIARLSGDAPTPDGETAASAVYQLGPEAITFAHPVGVTLPVAGSPKPEEVRVYRVDPTTNESVLQSGVYDPATKTVTAQATHFSPWYVTTRPADAQISGAFKFVNTGSAGWLNVCAKSFTPRFTDQQASKPTAVIAVAPSGTIGWSSDVHWFVPQGTYSLCIEYQTKGTISTPPGDPVHIVLDGQVVDQPWTASSPVATEISYGALPDPTDGACACTPTPTTGDRVFYNGNVAAVQNKPTKPTEFTTDRCYYITSMYNYHWNNGQGKTPGQVGFTAGGTVYGPWQSTGAPGQGGVVDAYWYVYPNLKLPAGTYTVTDSDPDTWAQNFESEGAGMTEVFGFPCP